MRVPHLCIRRAAFALGLLLLVAVPLVAQDEDAARPAPASEPRLRVFLDCPTGGCDRNYLVTNLPFVLWTQDRLDADVHALITGLGTAAGGTEYTIALLGRAAFAARSDTLRATILPNSTDEMRRREMARVLTIGLLPFAVRVSDSGPFSVRYDAPPNAGSGIGSVIRDPWNFWVYRLRANGSGNAESLNSSYNINGSVNVSRTTESWKLSLNLYEEYRANTFTLSDGSEPTYILRSSDVSARVVRSVSEHWSIGARGTGGRSDFRNQDAFGGLDLSAEYNVFPWKEATSRQLIAAVALGGRFYDYQDTTIYDLVAETRPIARAILAGESRQQWGTLDASLRYTHFLHDAATYNVSFNGRAQFRITRGLALEIRGDAAKVNDQLYLRRDGASDEEVLTRQRALATNFRIGGSVGLSFTFGSIYNTIVNPRLDELGT
ncbi:MAG TPA: hypothetical protein PLY94_00560 [Gemmatimonadaceae bacterium]|nr:hypothetical protein [Gemmatimonadaceae bacterium]